MLCALPWVPWRKNSMTSLGSARSGSGRQPMATQGPRTQTLNDEATSQLSPLLHSHSWASQEVPASWTAGEQKRQLLPLETPPIMPLGDWQGPANLLLIFPPSFHRSCWASYQCSGSAEKGAVKWLEGTTVGKFTKMPWQYKAWARVSLGPGPDAAR